MNATTSAEQVALTVPERAAVALGASAYELKLRELLSNSCRIVAPANKAARDECHAAYMVLKNARCSIVNLTEDATEDAKAFTKAVKTESERLIAITSAEEDRLKALRDAWDDKIEAEKQAKIAEERRRVEDIANCIAAIREDETDAIRICKTAAEVRDTLAYCEARAITEVIFQERLAEVMEIHAAVLVSIRAILAEREAQEAAALAAEEAHKAEAARIEQERAELARQQAAAAIVAAEQAAEAKRLADAAQALADQAQKEQAERDRVAADTKRQLEAQQAAIAAQTRALAEQQAAADARDAAALAAAQDAKRREDDHGPALKINAQFDAIRAERDAEAAHASEADAHTPALSLEQLAADADDITPTDEEIFAFGDECGMDRVQWLARLARFVGDYKTEVA